ncbi:MAG: DUF3047 domain-containing protein [Candidatus Omnitrophica bacterium]|nr:DUF3047 domain-containing protein [Candidatus Omnitrophota bacterium]
MTAGRRTRFLLLILLLQASLALAMFSVYDPNCRASLWQGGPGGTKTPAANYGTSAGFKVLKRFSFDGEEPLKDWEEKIFRKKTAYTVMREAGRGFLNSASAGASSGLYTKLNLEVSPDLLLSWRWRAIRFPRKKSPDRLSDSRQDDFAARLYVIFPGSNFFNSHVIEYLWDEKVRAGKVESSPFSNKVKLFVLRSGEPDRKEDWAEEERNIYDDYRRLFGEEPRRPLGALAIMSDSDNTGTTSESDFSEILIKTKDKTAAAPAMITEPRA